MTFKHEELAAGGWHQFALAEQMGNIGSEILRASRHKGNDEVSFRHAVERALELFDLTLTDPRWKGRRVEVARARELFCDALYGGALYNSSLEGLIPYFDHFAFGARKGVV